MNFRSGKYAGLSIAHVQEIAPWYIAWVKQNRPEMLRERKPGKPKGNSIMNGIIIVLAIYCVLRSIRQILEQQEHKEKTKRNGNGNR